MINLILASASPRRRELVKLLGYPYQTIPADVDESSIGHPDPAVNVSQRARLKAYAVAAQLNDKHDGDRKVVVAADTVVTLDGRMLGKPIDEADAQRMLDALRDRIHYVHTGITLIDMANGQGVNDVHTAIVTMRNYTDAEIDAYIATGDPMDKAGAYAIQHPLFRPVALLDGCYTAVMGLSLCQLLQALHRLQIPSLADMRAISEIHGQYDCPIYEELVASS